MSYATEVLQRIVSEPIERIYGVDERSTSVTKSIVNALELAESLASMRSAYGRVDDRPADVRSQVLGKDIFGIDRNLTGPKMGSGGTHSSGFSSFDDIAANFNARRKREEEEHGSRPRRVFSQRQPCYS